MKVWKRTAIAVCGTFALFGSIALRAQVAVPPTVIGPFVYDAGTNVTQIGIDRYTYDPMGRLKSGTAHMPGHDNRQTFTYDGFGNLKQVDTVNWPTLFIGVDSLTNRLLANAPTPQGPGTAVWGGSYDEAGNQEQLNGGAYRYAFDALGSMTELRTASGRRQFYIYDAGGERIATIDYADAANATWRYTIRDTGEKVVRTVVNDVAGGTTSWRWDRDYVYRDTLLLTSFAPDGVAHFHLDHRNSPALTTDGSHQKKSEHKYWPYGLDAPGSTADAEVMKFTGHERDLDGTVNALDYVHARYYSALLGRFLSVDPAAPTSVNPSERRTWNRYAYAGDNPMARIDPDGRRDIYVAFWNAKAPFIWGHGSVGHVGAFELNGKVILSQFPEPHGASGKNVRLSYRETLAKEENRLPDAVYKVFVPDDAGFDKNVAKKAAASEWNFFPTNEDQTHCAEAVDSSLLQGGVPALTLGTTPDKLQDALDTLIELQKEKPRPRSWSVMRVDRRIIESTPYQ